MKLSAADLSCLVPDTLEMRATASGKLDGKTFVTKDLLSISGHVSSFGHPRWRETHTKSTVTSPVISKLLEAGAELKGLAKLDQLAGSLIGNIGEGKAPLNPLYPDRFTGGSSSGSASAVAGDLVDFGIGTDTAGSIRVPAAACGLYGLRPTHGSITSEGVIPLAASFDMVGILSKDASLLRDVYQILSEKSGEPEPISKILVARDCLDLASREAAEVIAETVQGLIKERRLPVQEVSFAEYINKDIADLFSRIQTREVWHTRPDWLRKNRQYLAEDLRARMVLAEKRTADPQSEITADLQARKSYTAAISNIIGPGTLLVMPVMKDLPPLRDATAGELQAFREMAVRFNTICGLAGLPEVVIPATSSTGLTYGVGLIGSKNSDMALLDFVVN